MLYILLTGPWTYIKIPHYQWIPQSARSDTQILRIPTFCCNIYYLYHPEKTHHSFHGLSKGTGMRIVLKGMLVVYE